jgi:hypothetical protein
MPRRIEGRAGIEVFPTGSGQIGIKQDGEFGETDQLVVFDVNDVPVLLEWIRDVAADAAEIRRMNMQRVDEEQVTAH